MHHVLGAQLTIITAVAEIPTILEQERIIIPRELALERKPQTTTLEFITILRQGAPTILLITV